MLSLSLYGQRFLYAALCSMRGHVGYGVIYPRFPPPQLRRYVCVRRRFARLSGSSLGRGKPTISLTSISPDPYACMGGSVSISQWATSLKWSCMGGLGWASRNGTRRLEGVGGRVQSPLAVAKTPKLCVFLFSADFRGAGRFRCRNFRQRVKWAACSSAGRRALAGAAGAIGFTGGVRSHGGC